MSRRSLRPQLNQIRGWVRQGRTDAWIAHQLDVTVQQIQAFKREQDLEADGNEGAGTFDDEVDLRAEDDAAIAAELEEEARKRAEEEAREAEEAARKAAEAEATAAAAGEQDEEDEAKPKRTRRSRGGTRTRRRSAVPSPLEGTFDHGEEGYGLWLDPAVQDDPVYAEHWAGHRPVEITIEEDQIVIRRAGGGEDDDED
jgi:biotin carboxyl carrier protein